MKKTLLALISSVGISSAFANPWWIDVGGGIAGIGVTKQVSSGALPGISGEIDANYMISKHQLITARVTDITSPFIFTTLNMNDVGILYGLINKGKYAYISGSVGLAYSTMNVGAFDVNSQRISRLGVPIEINLGITPTQHLGFGIKLFSNINKDVIGYGALAEIQLGNLRF